MFFDFFADLDDDPPPRHPGEGQPYLLGLHCDPPQGCGRDGEAMAQPSDSWAATPDDHLWTCPHCGHVAGVSGP